MNPPSPSLPKSNQPQAQTSEEATQSLASSSQESMEFESPCPSSHSSLSSPPSPSSLPQILSPGSSSCTTTLSSDDIEQASRGESENNVEVEKKEEKEELCNPKTNDNKSTPDDSNDSTTFDDIDVDDNDQKNDAQNTSQCINMNGSHLMDNDSIDDGGDNDNSVEKSGETNQKHDHDNNGSLITTTNNPIQSTNETETQQESSYDCENHTTTTNEPKPLQLSFDNFLDLQTRLVLLPYQDDECLGATIASYIPSPSSGDSHNNSDDENNIDLTGCILTGIPELGRQNSSLSNMKQTEEIHWTRKDYTSILSAIRDAPKPTILHFHHPDQWSTYQSQINSDNENKNDDQEEQTEDNDVVVGDDKAPTKQNKSSKVSNHDSANNGEDQECKDSKTCFEINTNNGIVLVEEDTDNTEENKQINRSFDKSNNNALSGRFQRWGSHFAAEATKAVIAGKEIAREKVNERFAHQQMQQQQQQQQDQQCSQRQQKQQQDEVFPKEVGEIEKSDDDKLSMNISSSEATDGETNQLTEVELSEIKLSSKQSLHMGDPQIQSKHRSLHNGTSSQEHNDKKSKNNEHRSGLCGLFLQTSFGKCTPLRSELYKPSKNRSRSLPQGSDLNHSSNGKKNAKINNIFKKGPPIISNTSVLVIRRSATEACPTLGYHYQWYKTSQPQAFLNQRKEQNPDTEDAWIELDGATSVMFQPSVTDVGYRVKCIVTVKESDETEPGKEILVTCELPFVIESDPTLFNAATKTFVPMSDGAVGMKTSSFGNLVGRDEFEGLQVRIKLHVMQDDDIQGGFYMSISSNLEQPIHDSDKPITEVSASSYTYKNKSFYLVYRDGPSGEFSMLKLKSPSRLARETFLMALGIAKFQGHVSNLDIYSSLFADFEMFSTTSEKTCKLDIARSCQQKDDQRRKEESMQIQSPLVIKNIQHDYEKGTPMNSKMLAIESELENGLAELHDELSHLHDDYNASKSEYIECKKNLRLSERRIESLESDIGRIKNDLKKHEVQSKQQLAAKDEKICALEKYLKSLENEKAVLSAAVEARESKVLKMSSQLNEMELLKQKAQICEKIQHELNTQREKHDTLISDFDKMTAMKQTVMNELEVAREYIGQLETNIEDEKKSLTAVKLEASNFKLQFQKARGERNTYKQKADSLVKEMSRICRNGKEIEDIEKLMNENELLKTEMAQLRSEKKKAIHKAEQCRTEYEEYVKAQIQSGKETLCVNIVKRNIELERIVTEMTEYLNAKQMQLESVQDANRALTEELRLMAEKYRQQNDV